METTESLTVDFGNLADMRAKLPRAHEILERKEARLRTQEQDTESWRAFVAMLENLAGAPARQEQIEAGHENGNAAVAPVDGNLDLVVGVVAREVRPIRALEVGKILRNEGHVISNAAVS